MKSADFCVFAVLAIGASTTLAQDAKQDKLNRYLVDITGGAVSASALVGLDKGVSQVETSQDLVLAFQGLSTDAGKAAFGLAITPARSDFLPMSGRTYTGNPLAPLLGNLTLSYGRNAAEIAKVVYRKTAFSLGTVVYFNKEQDPVVIGNRAFQVCARDQEAQNASDLVAVTSNAALSAEAKDTALQAITDAVDKKLQPCIDKKIKQDTAWNSSRASLTYGDARIKAAGGERLRLGRLVTLNLQWGLGESGLLAVSLRRAMHALDTATLGKASQTYGSASLVAARWTYGDREGTTMRALIEASNAKSSKAGIFKDSFMYALGADRKLAPGVWLELRLGRNRSHEDGKEQTAALANLSLSPSLLPFKL